MSLNAKLVSRERAAHHAAGLAACSPLQKELVMCDPAPPLPPELRTQKHAGPRELSMQDRLLVAAHIETLAMQDSTLRVIADTVIDCVRCCDYFPECAHVVDESERVDKEEGRV